MEPETLISIQSATLRFRNKVIFEDLDFEWKRGQHWAVMGPNGSGKSALLQTLAGKFITTRGSVAHPFSEPFYEAESRGNPFFTYHDLISVVDIRHDFRTRSNTKEFYYQQRYNADDADAAPTVAEYLQSKVQPLARMPFWTPDKVRDKMRLEALWHKSLIKLSNGESKRLRIAAALLKNPVVLLLDNTFTGLDVHTRRAFNELFTEIAASGVHLVMVTTPGEIPDVVTDVIILDACRVKAVLKRKDFRPGDWMTEAAHRIRYDTLEELIRSGPELPHFHFMVKMVNVSVRYGDAVILDRLSWEVRQGERWALSGPNGSGKSTLLSLINGDHPQAYANDITLFDRKRGTGESIWDIKRHIGFMSPELYQYFPTHYTCLEVVISGLYESLGTNKEGTPAEREAALRWLELLDLEDVQGRTLADVPASKQRLCLLARALVKKPVLLILDEPCQGLDSRHQQQFRGIIDKIGEWSSVSLIYVTHYQEELPDCVDQVLKLE